MGDCKEMSLFWVVFGNNVECVDDGYEVLVYCVILEVWRVVGFRIWLVLYMRFVVIVVEKFGSEVLGVFFYDDELWGNIVEYCGFVKEFCVFGVEWLCYVEFV